MNVWKRALKGRARHLKESPLNGGSLAVAAALAMWLAAGLERARASMHAPQAGAAGILRLPFFLSTRPLPGSASTSQSGQRRRHWQHLVVRRGTRAIPWRPVGLRPAAAKPQAPWRRPKLPCGSRERSPGFRLSGLLTGAATEVSVPCDRCVHSNSGICATFAGTVGDHVRVTTRRNGSSAPRPRRLTDG